MSQPKKKESPASTPSSPTPKLVPDRDPGLASDRGPALRLPPRRTLILGSIIAGGLIVIVAALGAFAFVSQANGIVGGVRVADIPIGGLKSSDALTKVEAAWKNYQTQPMVFTADGKQLPLQIVTTTKTEDELIVTELVSFSPVAAVNRAATFGHRGSFWQQVRERLSGFLGRTHELGQVSVLTDVIKDDLRQKLADKNKDPIDASIKLTDGVPAVTSSATGAKFDVAAAARKAARQGAKLNRAAITVKTETLQPLFHESETLQRLATTETDDVLTKAPLTLKLDSKTWTIDKDKLATLLGFRVDSKKATRVGFDRTKTMAYLETLRSDIDVEPREARFQVTGTKVEAFATSQVGRTLELFATIDRLNAALDGTDRTVNVAVTEQQPISKSITPNSLGIKELVAEATTNFSGSPTNRRYNLSYGARLLNGLLIKPGETFSLVKALGPIDAAHGWKSELVIKGPKIKPEFGGGLCQVATTMFRTALNAGLPIIERSNHSLRIRYYEPPIGLDATIYEPRPDLRFTNDYGSYLLLQTEVIGNNITFRFYGTKDGRSVDLPTPKVYNRTGIPATTYTETTDLKPGQQECQAPGHPGADATATYTVTKADGSKKTQVFQSHYRALGVICRVGKKADPKPKPTTTNTNSSSSTNSSANTNS